MRISDWSSDVCSSDLFVEGKDSVKFAKSPTQWMTMIPTIYNADTLGIRQDLVGRPIGNWKDIMDPKFKGKTSILNIPSIGIMDAAMICASMGEIKYGDKGNMPKAEIDKNINEIGRASCRESVCQYVSM